MQLPKTSTDGADLDPTFSGDGMSSLYGGARTSIHGMATSDNGSLMVVGTILENQGESLILAGLPVQ